MSGAAKAILDSALKLGSAERAAIARELLESIEADPGEDLERSWNEELARRREKIERGEAVFHSGDELQRRVDKALDGD